jgi:excisionase family DNA binding protein
MNLSSDLIAGAAGAASYTGLSTRAVYHLVAKGALPAVKIGRRMYFRKTALDAVFTVTEQAA